MADKNNSLGFDTTCIRGGHKPESNRAHLTPIYASSTYTFDSAEQAIAVFKGQEEGYIYGRWGNPTIAEAEEKIALLEAYGIQDKNGKPLELKALLHSSGMAAICTMLLGNIKAGQKIITHYSLYGGTHELVEKILPDLDIAPVIVDFHDLSKVEEAIKADKSIRLMHIETPANPTLQCVDIEALATLGKKYGLIICVDNTFATPYLQQPFRYDVDYVMHSTTKFLNGHGTLIGGVMIGRDIEKMSKGITKTHRLLGGNSNAFEAFLLVNGLRTFGLRMERHCSNAQKVAEFLDGHAGVDKVNYLGLPSHPDYTTAQKQMKNGGAMLSFELKGGFDAGISFINNLKMCTNAVSLGTCDTLVCHAASTTHLGVAREKRLEFELPYVLRELAIYIDIGLPYEECIARLARGKHELAREAAAARREIDSGSSVQSSFARISSSSGSLALKRSLQLMSTIYETGKGTGPLRRMADDLSTAQISDMRAQAGKFSLLAIAFIAVSALIPSFFSVFAAVSPLVQGNQVPQWQVWLAFLLVFPALDAAALLAMFLLLPPVKAEKGAGALDEYLAGRGVHMSGRGFATALAALSLALACASLAAGNASLAIVSICMGPAIYSLAAYLSDDELRRAELLLPDALYTAASTHKLLSAEKMLALLAKGGFGRVSDAFALALARQKAGDSFQSSMQAAARYCPAPLAARAFSLIVVAYETGADMYSALRECAQDVVSFFALLRERAALLSIQRYTVLASSALLVPIILGTVVFLAPTLSGTSVAGTGAPADVALLSTLALACQIYLVLNAALSALLLSLSESNPARAALYFAICAPLALIFFSIASSSALALG